ncbi:MAG: endo-1,4-beta-xylanase, partial [Bacteroidales bacterium]|nr:endo-1,4-beta-xylanase [Bacteroidales bacterium]
ALDKEVTSASNQIAMGMHSDKSDYYLDNIVFRGQYDNYVLVGNDKFDFSGQNSSSDYKTFDTPLNVPYGASATLYTARYSYFNSPVMGEGTINIYSGGERTYLGYSDKSYPDWSRYRGDVHVYPYKNLSSTNGFYGLVLMHRGKVVTPENAQADADEGKMNTCLTHSTLVLHNGATLAIEGSDKNRGARIGRLQMEEGSSLMGYYKSKDAANSYYLVGGTNDDALLAGRIAPASDNKKMLLGLIKEGTGTYRITGNTNLISGGVRVISGRVLFNNDAALAKNNKLSGSLGTPASATTAGLVVLQQGTAGGTGHIAAGVNLYGILQPGDDGTGQLAIADYASANALTLIVRPSARLEFQIASATDYDQLTVAGPVSYYNILQDYSESDMMPRLRIQLMADAQLNVGDEFVLFSANSKAAYNDVEWQFDVRYPKAYTWAVEQTTAADGTFRVTARVTSLEYGGQGEVEDSDIMPGEIVTDDGTFDLAAEQRETSTSLRSFADAIGQYIGTCVPVWKLNVDNDNDVRTRLIAGQYNAVVCENEMKFDATEPNRGQFSFGSGDQLIALANRHN